MKLKGIIDNSNNKRRIESIYNIADLRGSLSFKDNSETMSNQSMKYYTIENDELKYQVPSI